MALSPLRPVLAGTGLAIVLGGLLLPAAEPPPTTGGLPTGRRPPTSGPDTEKRFPPLQVPDGFKATLFACDPLVEYPSAIAPGPRPGSLFVAVDYLTGLGTGLERRDEIRLLEDTDGDGYADRATVFAGGLNSVQGLAFHDGTLYAMNAPYLTALRDTTGAGKADERHVLLGGLGLAPEKDQIRLHNANGVVAGHDGWLYLALGDRGCDVLRPEGDRLVLEGGGILRCRPDGRDLHVFATGLRNIYDVALDAELNVFVRDNENDGGTYMIRVCHSFFGADHGYPYLYEERPDEALPPLADLGLGSSAGGLCYLERQFPPEYRGSLFFCEWGRAVVRYPLRRTDAGPFASPKEIDFAAGAPNDPYGFKPTDLVVARDGSLFIADWADGQRPRRGRGRIYQVRYASKKGEKPPPPEMAAKLPADLDQAVSRLDSERALERCEAQAVVEGRGKDGAAALDAALKKGKLGPRGRGHAVCALAKLGGAAAAEKLLALAKSDPEPSVQAQAVRAVADLADPVLVKHRLDAGAGDAALAERIAALAAGADWRVQLEAVVALGRLRWAGVADWLRKNLAKPDPVLAHAVQWALRRSGDWPAVLKLLDKPGTEPLHAVARRAAAGQYDRGLVDGLIERLAKETDPVRRRELADLLTRVSKKPPPWTYWGFRAAPRPANTVAWERTEAIEQALDRVLADPDRGLRLTVLGRMLREKVPPGTDTLCRWLKEERQAETVATLLAALRDRSDAQTRPALEAVVTDPKHTPMNRLLAVSLFLQGLDAAGEDRLTAMAGAVEDGPVLAELLRGIGTRKVSAGSKLLLRKATSKDGEVRASAAVALAEVGGRESQEAVGKLLGDGDTRVRAAAALAAGKLLLRPAAERLLKLARDPDAEVRRSSLEALRLLHDPRALPAAVAALQDQETALPALECVGDLGGPEQAKAVADLAQRRPAADVLTAAGKVLTGWAARDGLSAAGRQQIEQALAELHGGSGVLLGWHVLGPLPDDGDDLVGKVSAGQDPATGWRPVLSAGTDARVGLSGIKTEGAWLAYSEIAVSEPVKVEFFTTASAPQTVWLDGKVVHRRDRPAVPGPYPDRFEATLAKGRNRVLVRLTGLKGTGEFQLRFRRKSATAEHERLTLAALSRAGNPEHGRQVFLDAEKSLCLKCHRLGDKGERVGPELTGLGGRFGKAYIVESILEPSRTVAPSFETTLVELKNGKVVSGVKVAETETTITVVDSTAQKHVLARSEVESQTRQAASTMPEGLEKRLTEDEFVDLVSFLVRLR
jgi:putative membrane-bound dehydrogenase-like protein